MKEGFAERNLYLQRIKGRRPLILGDYSPGAKGPWGLIIRNPFPYAVRLGAFGPSLKGYG